MVSVEEIRKMEKGGEDAMSPLMKWHMDQLRKIPDLGEAVADFHFGMMLLKHSHDEYLFEYYRRLYESSNSNFFGYKIVKEMKLKYKASGISGTVLALDSDEVFDVMLNEDEIDILGTGALSIFFDTTVSVPLPFIFVPLCPLYDVCDFMENVFGEGADQTVMIGTSGCVHTIIVEPGTLYNLSLGFLCEKIVESGNVSSLLCGFAYMNR